MGIISSTICSCTFLVPVPGSLMNLARISPAEFLPQMASKPLTAHESWSLQVQPDHVLCSSHAEARGKMNNKITLHELCVLGLCSSAIRFKTEPLRSRPFNWELLKPLLGCLSDYTLMTRKFTNKHRKKLPNSQLPTLPERMHW